MESVTSRPAQISRFQQDQKEHRKFSHPCLRPTLPTELHTTKSPPPRAVTPHCSSLPEETATALTLSGSLEALQSILYLKQNLNPSHPSKVEQSLVVFARCRLCNHAPRVCVSVEAVEILYAGTDGNERDNLTASYLLQGFYTSDTCIREPVMHTKCNLIRTIYRFD